MNTKKHRLSLMCAALALTSMLPAEEAEPLGFVDAVTKGKPSVNLRLRAETASQDGRGDSTALTGRLRLGYGTQSWYGLSLFAEMEYTDAVDTQEYNAAGVTGDSTKSIIADPPSSELNQAYLAWGGFDTVAKGGRQRIVIANARFVGDVGWRQNQQTYDGFYINNQSVEGLNATYSYISQVNRIFGSNSEGAQRIFEGDIHVFHVVYSGLPVKIGAQAFLLDIDNAAANSSDTFGAYLSGKAKLTEKSALAYYGEVAFQETGDNNPNDGETLYLHGALTYSFGPYALIGGYELLGADEMDDGEYVSFRTPLATLHKFNGWADVFLVTPPTGLEDLYIGASAKLPYGIVAKAFYHSFSSDEESIDYGDEIDLLLVKGLPLGKLIAKYANYSADEFGVDTERFSFEYTCNF